MKGAALISKRPDFFQAFCQHAENSGYEGLRGDDVGMVQSFRIAHPDDSYFMIYDREEGDFLEEHEIPKSAIKGGYRYGFLVECRSEDMFCEIVGSVPPGLEMLVMDNSGHLYRPDEISPETISL